MMTGEWDECFGAKENEDGTLGVPGIVRGSANLIGGSPGAGKSTLFLQMSANVIERYELPVLYLASEEQLPQIKSRAERLKIKGNRLLRFVDLRKGTADLSIILRAHKFGFLILDSLKALAESPEDCIVLCKVIKEFATFLHAPAVISQHVNKGGDMAGLMSLQHEVDATLTFFPDEDDINPENNEPLRVMHTVKNRNGRAGVDVELDMSVRGLSPRTRPEPDELEALDELESED
jgi:DNA repair protein RadA/Sms